MSKLFMAGVVAISVLYVGVVITAANNTKNELERYILQGSYITNTHGTDHDLEEGVGPKEAAKIFYEKGWRVENGVVLSPDDIVKRENKNNETKQ